MHRTSSPVLLALLLVLAGVTSAWGEALQADLSGYEEVLPVSTPASGEFRGNISNDGNFLDYELRYSGLQDVRQAHIHFGQTGVNGGISVFLCQTTTNPDPTGLAPTCPAQAGSVTGTVTSANVIGPGGQGIAAGELAELIQAIRNGTSYVNVHTGGFPGGEIRGQIKRASQR